MKLNEIGSEIEKSLKAAIKEHLIATGQLKIRGRQMIVDKIVDVNSKFNSNEIDPVVLFNGELVELNINGIVSLYEIRDGDSRNSAFTFQIRAAKVKFESGSFHSDVSKLLPIDFA